MSLQIQQCASPAPERVDRDLHAATRPFGGFYRLPEAMATIPELQHPTVTPLRFHDVVACFRANIWDDAGRRMIRYRELSR